jgi:primosomal protein N' (replication factor Y)
LHEVKPVSLLHGVTGSGKTEIYLSLCEHILSRGQSVLIIVPEIALTPIMMSYLLDRFGEDVALLHSELSPSEKYDEYRRIVQKKARIVVGARSAVFAPLTNLGLIVLDEEHSETYKQDNSPSYHARDIAIWRGSFHRAKVLLGSATPSLESKARAEKNVYGHYVLDQRVNEKAPPKTTIIDLNRTDLLVSEASMFTQPLLEKMRVVLAQKEQIILLVNRRGYSTSLVCRQCNLTLRCPHCEIPLAYHQQHNLLKCHYCDYRAYPPTSCPDCGAHDLMHRGFGIEKVEEHLTHLFPNKTIIRLDSDNASIREHMLRDLKTFQEGNADILLGTQMVAKGHDFPNVTLVGVLLADMGLNVPSYRATERTFQLLSQVVGRTGRGHKDGEAMIQTYHPNHYVIQTGSKQDYMAFYQQEMMARKATQYPPYTFLTMLEVASTDDVLLSETVMNLYRYLQEKIPDSDHLIGPNIPYPEKQGPYFRRRILLKYKNKDAMIALTQDVFSILQGKRNIRFQFNVDPYVI